MRPLQVGEVLIEGLGVAQQVDELRVGQFDTPLGGFLAGDHDVHEGDVLVYVAVDRVEEGPYGVVLVGDRLVGDRLDAVVAGAQGAQLVAPAGVQLGVEIEAVSANSSSSAVCWGYPVFWDALAGRSARFVPGVELGPGAGRFWRGWSARQSFPPPMSAPTAVAMMVPRVGIQAVPTVALGWQSGMTATRLKKKGSALRHWI